MTSFASNISEDEAIRLVGNSHCAKSLSPDARLLRVTRELDLEDNLFSLQTKDRNAISQDTFVFKVTNTGYFVLSPTEYIHVDTTGEKFLLISVSKRLGHVFPLYGCQDPDKSFAALIGELKVRVPTTADAERFALTHYFLTRDPEGKRLVLSFMDFRHHVEDYLFSAFETENFEDKFRNWLDKDIRRGLGLRTGLHSQKMDAGYRTEITFVKRSPPGPLELERLVLGLDRNGAIRNLELSTAVSVTRHLTNVVTTLGSR